MKNFLFLFIKIFVIFAISYLTYYTIDYNLGISLISVSFLITLMVNYRYALIYFIPGLIFQEYLLILILLANYFPYLCLKKYYLKNKLSTLFFLSSLSLVTSLIYAIINNIEIYIVFITLPMIMSLLYAFLYTTDIYYYQKNNKVLIKNYHFLSSIMILISSIGALKYEYGLIAILLFIFYLSYIGEYLISFFIATLLMLIYQKEINYIFPIFSLISLYPFLGFVISFFYVLYNVLFKEPSFFLLNLEIALLIIGIFLLIKKYENKEKSYSFYQNMTNNFNNQILKFASFLDEFKRLFLNNYDSNKNLSEAFGIILNTFCQTCTRTNECFKERKNETYLFIRNALVYGNDLHLLKSTKDMMNKNKNCHYSNEIIARAHQLRNRYNLNENKNNVEKNLEAQINGLSNTLRQYAIDLSITKEMDVSLFLKLRDTIKIYGYNILMYDIKKFFKGDFWIEIGVSHISINDIKEIINPLADNTLKEKTSIILKKSSGDVCYFSIIPKIHFNILYGYGSLAKSNLNISGDNYMIKDTDNGSFLAAISDGMGSGYYAYNESKMTLKLVDKITDLKINTKASINMLNTFYSLKENQDSYATLDLLEIDKKSGDALLYKMGSSDTIIYSENEMRIINNTLLPVGINDLITEEVIKIKNGDIILLISDGIRDNISDQSLIDVLSHSTNIHPQKICYNILNTILNSAKKSSDDMSIVAIKVEKIA